MKVGVLALQGDVREHAFALDRAGATPVAVKTRDEVAAVDALVLPGGESTTIGKLLDRFGLLERVRGRVEEGMPLFGTCAGLILMSREVVGPEDAPDRLGCLDVSVRRNAYGRQVASFETELEIAGLDRPFRAVFIRSPEIEQVGEGVEVLAAISGSPVLVRSGALLGAAFHPEMTDDPRVHELFITMVRG